VCCCKIILSLVEILSPFTHRHQFIHNEVKKYQNMIYVKLRSVNLPATLTPQRSHVAKVLVKGKGKAVSLQASSGPEGSRKLRFPDIMTTAQDGGKIVSLTHRLPLLPGNTPGTHFCYRLSRPPGP
jgi:hypothetical protein